MNIKNINPGNPDPHIIDQAGKIIGQGGIIVFPTLSLYGLGADPFNSEAVERIFNIKGRCHDKPILILINKISHLEKAAAKIPPMAWKIIDEFWPGGVTIVFHAAPHIPDNLTCGTKKIGVRMCGHPVASAILKAVGTPITGTSANISGKGGYSCVARLDPYISARVDMIINAGNLKGGTGSTVVDVTGEFPVILREGVIAGERILRVCGL